MTMVHAVVRIGHSFAKRACTAVVCRVHPFLAAGLAAFGCGQALAQDFGSFASSSGHLLLSAGSGSPDISDFKNFSTPGGLQAQATMLLPPLDSGVQATTNPTVPGDLTVHGQFSVTGSIVGPTLHGSTLAAADNVHTCIGDICTSTSAGANLTELWIDHLVANAPVGVNEVQLTFTPFFEGGFFADAPYVPNSVGAPIGPTEAIFVYQIQSNIGAVLEGTYDHVFSGNTSFRDAASQVMTVRTGVPFGIELQMLLSSNAGEGFGPSLSEVSALNTGGLFISVDTEGASLTAASGQDYAAPFASAVPEPSTFAMWCGGLLVLLLLRCQGKSEKGAGKLPSNVSVRTAQA
ncbi:MAG TPA: hypothetical protein VF169_14990 [Albitalea sp.]|uniref:hypothetical protein n=1 Tax=Piscinibacter sp. TaxID=1903157 RepID=UPI002ED034C4